MNPIEKLINDPESVEVIKDALALGVIEGFSLENDPKIVLDPIEGLELDVRPRRQSYRYLGFAMMASAMSGLADIDYTPYDKIALSGGKRTKRIDIYREYKPNPDAQPRNERCKCGSGNKHKHCCIKK